MHVRWSLCPRVLTTVAPGIHCTGIVTGQEVDSTNKAEKLIYEGLGRLVK